MTRFGQMFRRGHGHKFGHEFGHGLRHGLGHVEIYNFGRGFGHGQGIFLDFGLGHGLGQSRDFGHGHGHVRNLGQRSDTDTTSDTRVRLSLDVTSLQNANLAVVSLENPLKICIHKNEPFL